MSYEIFLNMNADILIKQLQLNNILIKQLPLSLYIWYFLLVFVFYLTSICELTSLDILPNSDNVSFEPKQYCIDFLSH